jgi:molybdopterin/thiamine biosynthesis adenylyltransferase
MDREIIHARHVGIVHPDQLLFPVTVIGVGAIGSTMARLLSQIGFRTFRYYDGDRVVGENVGVQFYREADKGKRKVIACRDNVRRFITALDIEVHAEPYVDQPLDGLVVVGVDNIQTRSTIWKAVRRDAHQIPLLVDGRTAGEEVHVYVIRPTFLEDGDLYTESLVPNPPGSGLPCGEQGAPHAQSVIAGLMTNAMVRWIRCEPYPRYTLFNLRSMWFEKCSIVPL